MQFVCQKMYKFYIFMFYLVFGCEIKITQ